MDHVVGIFDDATANWEIKLVCSSKVEGVVTKSMYDFRLVGLSPWRTSGYLIRIDLYLVGSYHGRNNESWEVFS